MFSAADGAVDGVARGTICADVSHVNRESGMRHIVAFLLVRAVARF